MMSPRRQRIPIQLRFAVISSLDSSKDLAMNFRHRIASHRGRLAGASLMLSGAIWLEPMGMAHGEDRVSQPVAGRLQVAPEAMPAIDALDANTGARAARSSLEVRADGKATPGSRVTIGLVGQPDPKVSYQWVQIDGPPVTIEDSSQPKIQVTIPHGASSLGFLLTMTDGKGQTTARFSLPIDNRKRTEAVPVSRADAGDDQVGLVGHRITLSGAGATAPREGITYRWFQLAGPKVEKGTQERNFYTFVPQEPGLYRFGLVTAWGGGSAAPAISEMDEVLVTVGELSTVYGGTAGAGLSNGVSLVALDQVLQGPGGATARATLDQIAGILEAIAGRAALYSSFADLSSEMVRRIDAAIPSDQSVRQFWSSSVFGPLTQHITTEMLSVGLDLRTPQAANLALSPFQQQKLQRLFNYYAREFRSRTQAR
jgi:hypothetical protein